MGECPRSLGAAIGLQPDKVRECGDGHDFSNFCRRSANEISIHDKNVIKVSDLLPVTGISLCLPSAIEIG